jgi:hypothetical protein
MALLQLVSRLWAKPIGMSFGQRWHEPGFCPRAAGAQLLREGARYSNPRGSFGSPPSPGRESSWSGDEPVLAHFYRNARFAWCLATKSRIASMGGPAAAGASRFKVLKGNYRRSFGSKYPPTCSLVARLGHAASSVTDHPAESDAAVARTAGRQ